MTSVNENVRSMEFIGLDDWNRPVYRCVENGILWKDLSLGRGIPELYSCGNSIDGEPDSPIREDLEVVFNSKYEEDPNRFNYMMLSRLRMDVEYYLGNGNRSKRCLYYQDEKEHIQKMKELHNSFPDDAKPEWLTYDDILNYEKQMVAQ